MRRTLTVAGLSIALLLTGAPLAQADSEGYSGAGRTGSCSGRAHWQLNASRDDGRIEVDWEVDSHRAGQDWRLRIRDNGVLVAAAHDTSRHRDGSVDLERSIANRPGTDRIVARARNLSTGQFCVGRVSR